MRDDDAKLARSQQIARVFADRWRGWKERQEGRDNHFFRTPAVDPVVGPVDDNGQPTKDSPYASVERYQHIRLMRTAMRLVARLTENHYIVDVVAPDKAKGEIKAAANDIAAALNSWGADMEERAGTPWQHQMAWGQCRAPYAVMQYRRCEDLWPKLEYEWADAPPKGREQDFGLYVEGEEDEEADCPACGGTGMPASYGEAERCPECEGRGTIITGKRQKKRFREKGAVYLERRNKKFARAGSPWHVSFVDPLNFVPEFDNNPRGGLKRALVHYDVSLIDYEEAAEASGGKMSATDLNTAAPAPGVETGEGQYSYSTATSGDYQNRIHVYQLWDREWYYEWTSSDPTGGELKLKKCFEHGYGRVPLRIVPAWDTGHPDPQWRFLSALENEYDVKPFWDRLFTFFGAIVELTAIPLLERQYEPGKTPILAEDGSPDSDQPGSVAATATGGKLQQLQIQLPPGVGQFMGTLNELFAEASPDTGQAEITATTAPWAARLAQSQANVEPRMLLSQHTIALQWLFSGILDWHASHGEPLIAYARDDAGRLDRSKVIVVQPKKDGEDQKDAVDLDLFDVAVTISPTSSAEQITQVEHMIAQATPNEAGQTWRLREEVFEAMGKRDPKAYEQQLLAEKVIAPIKEQIITAQVGYQVANTATTIFGPNNEILSSLTGAPIDPRQALQQAGWQPAMPQPTGPGMPPQGAPPPPQAGGAGMPQLPELNVPGQTPLGGMG